ncbi:hypothetical protein DYH09_07155 [bacterium CPR1]|nr:hypothetical protein [bacterium CPR1]
MVAEGAERIMIERPIPRSRPLLSPVTHRRGAGRFPRDEAGAPPICSQRKSSSVYFYRVLRLLESMAGDQPGTISSEIDFTVDVIE